MNKKLDENYVILMLPSHSALGAVRTACPFVTVDGNQAQIPADIKEELAKYLQEMGFVAEEDYQFMEADMQNGYGSEREHDSTGYDGTYFPSGQVSTAVDAKDLGPSAAKHGNNPMHGKKKVDENIDEEDEDRGEIFDGGDIVVFKKNSPYYHPGIWEISYNAIGAKESKPWIGDLRDGRGWYVYASELERFEPSNNIHAKYLYDLGHTELKKLVTLYGDELTDTLEQIGLGYYDEYGEFHPDVTDDEDVEENLILRDDVYEGIKSRLTAEYNRRTAALTESKVDSFRIFDIVTTEIFAGWPDTDGYDSAIRKIKSLMPGARPDIVADAINDAIQKHSDSKNPDYQSYWAEVTAELPRPHEEDMF